MSREATPICVAWGDGIGPEIMGATLAILEAAGARIRPEPIELGEAVYARGITSGIDPSAWEALRRNRVLLKAPITTPQGKGVKSLNVTLRKTLGLCVNLRPVRGLGREALGAQPVDLVIVRENEEGLYAGIEHRQTPEVSQCLKLVSRPGCERIVRYAFEYARAHGRRRVTCMSKDNIMKVTDGLLHQAFDRIRQEYPEIEADHAIIDIGAGRLAAHPERFDVVVTGNLYGDILSDIAAEITGSVGVCPSANLGSELAMFEAIHGSAPDIAGQDKANPSGLLLAAVMLLEHLGQGEVAARIHDAWLATIEQGEHTADLAVEGQTRALHGTRGFAQAVIARLGQRPSTLARPASRGAVQVPVAVRLPRPRKAMVGVDVFLDWDPPRRDPEALGAQLAPCGLPTLPLQMITNRGVLVWPGGQPETFCTDHWRCRFQAPAGAEVDHDALLALLARIRAAGFDFIKTETLCTFDGVPGYSLGQGQ